MFKVGDKVKRISHLNSRPGCNTMEVGAEGTVVTVGSGGWLVISGYEDLGLCNPCFFELVKPEPQAAAIAGGLQEHSVGEYYPLAAVLYEHGDERIVTIENLQTGEISAFHGWPIDWDTFDRAYQRIEEISKGSVVNYAKGRVSYVHGRWVVAEPANPVRVTRLRNMLHRG